MYNLTLCHLLLCRNSLICSFFFLKNPFSSFFLSSFSLSSLFHLRSSLSLCSCHIRSAFSSLNLLHSSSASILLFFSLFRSCSNSSTIYQIQHQPKAQKSTTLCITTHFFFSALQLLVPRDLDHHLEKIQPLPF